MRDLNVRAVLTGVTIDIVGTFIVGSIFSGIVAFATGADTPESLGTVFDGSVELQVISIALGLALTLAGAYVAASMARGAERAHAFAVGVVSTVVGFTIVFADPEAAPFWAEAVNLLLTIPVAYLAGEIRRAQTGGRPAP